MERNLRNLGNMVYVHVTMSKAQRQVRISFEQKTQEGRYVGHRGNEGALLVTTAKEILRGRSAKKRMTKDLKCFMAIWTDLKSLLCKRCSTEPKEKEANSEILGVR